MSPAANTFAFPDFKGATRWLVLSNLVSFFAFMLLSLAFPGPTMLLLGKLVFHTPAFLHGFLWQPFTYSFIHLPSQVLSTLLELLGVWFLVGFLENIHGAGWVTGLYAASVLGAAAAAITIYVASGTFNFALPAVPLYGCFGGLFGLTTVIGVLYGDVQFTLFPLPVSIKARWVAIIYLLVAMASLYGDMRIQAFAYLGGALAGYLYARLAPRRGVGFEMSEGLYGLRNRYYRWKRRNTARKFEVYMKSQGRTVKFDGEGRRIDDDPNDKSRWN
jgi:membrane associated rhomboid family serine protease